MSLTKPFANYPHVNEAGNLVFIAGQGCRDPRSNEYEGLIRAEDGSILSYDIGAQTRGVLRNVQAALETVQLGLKDLIDVQVFLKDLEKDFAEVNNVWNETFPKGGPSRTTVGVLDLPGDNFIEMKAIAYRREVE